MAFQSRHNRERRAGARLAAGIPGHRRGVLVALLVTVSGAHASPLMPPGASAWGAPAFGLPASAAIASEAPASGGPASAASASAESTSEPEGACWIPEETGWHTPEEILMAPPSSALSAFALLTRRFSADKILGAAGRTAERWLGAEQVELRGTGLRITKEYGGRLLVLTFEGLGPAAEEGVRADYRLGGAWFVRSESRERGESYLELRREIHFW